LRKLLIIFPLLGLLLYAGFAASDEAADAVSVQGVLLETPLPQAAADYRVPVNRSKENLPPLFFPPHAGTLKPRPITPKDFYLNLADVSNPHGLIVKFSEEAMIRWRDGKPYSKTGADVAAVLEFLARYPDIKMERDDPLQPEELFDYWEANGEKNTGQDLANLNNFYQFYIPQNPKPLDIVREVLTWDITETAFYLPQWQLACTDDPPATLNWEADQPYLDPAPLGINAEYSWNYHPTLGRGRADYWCIDVEMDWSENHEDFPQAFQVLGGGDAGGAADHGDAVMGIVAACNNGFGITGISSNVTPKAISWPTRSGITHQDKWISAFNLAAAYLLPGESYLIEIHYYGPDPGFGCDSVCGNCSQFRFIPVEYWDNVFTAIQTHTANGFIVYEAAGNGQMDLNNPVYGNRFQRSFRNSQAILVGAALPETREAECWSNFGSRVDLQGWGRDIFTLGYGNLWQGTADPDRSQWYTSSFGGTSGATPIAAGAGNLLQGISQGKFGMTLSPDQVRDYLSATGTAWTGSRDVGERPDLAQAINYIEPDVTSYHRAGWDNPVVPRAAMDAGWDDCHVTPYLYGNGNTYFNVIGINSGRSPAADCTSVGVYSELCVDSDGIYGLSWTPRIAPLQQMGGINLPAAVIRGGRHTLGWLLDPYNAFNEFSESNNSFFTQYVWSPISIANDNPIERIAPPLKTWGSPVYYNGDGFHAHGGWWLGVAVMPQLGNDVDLYTFNTSYSSTTGFDTWEKYSMRGTGFPDLIMVNGNIQGYNPTRYFQAVRYSDTSNQSYHVEADTSKPAYGVPCSMIGTLTNPEIFDMYELYLVSGQQYFIGITDVAAALDLSLLIFDPASSVESYWDCRWLANAHGAGGNEVVMVDADISGYYAAVVMKTGSGNYSTEGSFTFSVENPGLCNLVPGLNREGWDAPVVIRNDGGATADDCRFPAAIQGNTDNFISGTWFNNSMMPLDMTFANRVYVDNEAVTDFFHGGSLNPFSFGQELNVPIGPIRGGRHTLTLAVDADNDVAETNETDNTYSAQHVWSPLTLESGVPVNRSAPPARGSGVYPNGDGFAFSPFPEQGSAVCLLAESSTSDYDLYLYSDYAGTDSGFSFLIENSIHASGSSDYVFVPWRLSGTYSSYYPAIINYNGSNLSFRVEARQAEGRFETTHLWAAEDSLPPENLLHIYEFLLSGGVRYVFECGILAGNADLEIRLHPDSAEATARFDAVAVSDAGGPGEDEEFMFTPPLTDYYALIINKINSASLNEFSRYQLRIGPDSPLPVNDLRALKADSSDDIRLTWTHVQQSIFGLPLLNRLYVIYRSTTPQFTPTPAEYIGQTTDSTFTDPVSSSIPRYFYCVTVRND